MKKILFAALASIFAISSFAVVADPTPFDFTLPDGQVVKAVMHGDEFHSYITTEDGSTLLQGHYLNASEHKAVEMRRKQARTQIGGNFPLTGSPHSLVLLVNFTDQKMTHTLQEFDNLLNKKGYSVNGSTGSCRDYFEACSNGVFSPIFDVYGPFELAHDVKYYGEQDGDEHDKRPAEAIIEAFQLASEAGIKMSDYDTNKDGILDNVFVYYAGYNQAENGDDKKNTIWPHQANISSRNVKSIDNITLATYACTSEYKGNSTNICNIGTFCHEFGHVLGLPDFYDTENGKYTVDDWDIMSSGNYNNNGRTPPSYSCYERFYLGWLTPTQLSEPGRYMLQDMQSSNFAYLISEGKHNLDSRAPAPAEFFMLEYRAKTGWDAPDGAIPGYGMLVWHIDFLASAWANNSPNNNQNMLRMHLEEANGIKWKDRSSSMASDPYPGTGKVTRFTPILHNGTILDQPLFQITEADGVISFIYKNEGESRIQVTPTEIELTTSINDSKQVVEWNPQPFTLLAEGLDPQGKVTISVSGDFSLTTNASLPRRTSSEWKKSLEIYPAADSTLNQVIFVQYNPAKQNCSFVSSLISIGTETSSTAITVKGKAPRPVTVTTPVVNKPSEITPYSFCASWKPVKDAEEYYLTLFKREQGTSEFMQSFENFDDNAAIVEQGWQSTTNATTTSVKTDGTKSLLFKNTGDQVTSEQYQTYITSIKFWLNAFTAEEDEIGKIKVEAYNGKNWNTVEEALSVLSSTKKKTISYSFTSKDNYVQFRLTYTSLGGSGVALDAFVAACDEKITYINRGRELAVTAVDDDPDYTLYYFGGLDPNTEYYFQVQCTDLDKGCEEHLTALSEPQLVTTLDGEAPDSKKLTLGIDTITYNALTHVLYLPATATGNSVYVYDSQGHLVYSQNVASNATYVYLPTYNFVHGSVYAVKYSVTNSMKRKDKWAKFVY